MPSRRSASRPASPSVDGSLSPPAPASRKTPARLPRTVRAGTGLKARQAEATREHLIGTAIGLLHQRSYQGATVFEVAKAAGVTPGALQHHFGSKAALMMQVTEAILRASGPEGVAWPAADGPLPERCADLVQALWQRAYAPPRFLAAWAVYFGSGGEPELRSHIAQQRRTLAQALHQRFLQVLPELTAAADSKALVQLVLSALRGLGVVRLFGPAPADEQAQLQLLAQILESHCRSAPPTASASPARSRSSRRP